MSASLFLLWMIKALAILLVAALIVIAAAVVIGLLVYSARYVLDLVKGKL